MPSSRFYLYSHDKKIIGRTDFDAVARVSALNVAHRIFQSCSDICVSYELWEGPVLISSEDIKDQAAALNRYEQQVIVDTEIAPRDSWVGVKQSKNLLAALEALQGQMPSA